MKLLILVVNMSPSALGNLKRTIERQSFLVVPKQLLSFTNTVKGEGYIIAKNFSYQIIFFLPFFNSYFDYFV